MYNETLIPAFLVDSNVWLIPMFFFPPIIGLLVISFTSMASSNPLFDDIRSKADVDPPQIEESTDVGELVNDPAQTALKPNGTVSSSVRELLECPVCLSAMYPPIHQLFIYQ